MAITYMMAEPTFIAKHYKAPFNPGYMCCGVSKSMDRVIHACSSATRKLFHTLLELYLFCCEHCMIYYCSYNRYTLANVCTTWLSRNLSNVYRDIHLCEEITHNEHLAIEGPISDLPETNLIDQKEHVYISMT